MKSHHVLVTILAVLFLSACATPTKDIEATSETAAGVNLANYNSFAWVASAQIVNDPHGNWEPTGFDADAEIKFLLLKELRNKGLTETTTSPDLLLIFAAGVNMQNLEFVKDPNSKMSTLEEVPRGALLVVLIDPATRHPVWVGAAKGDVERGRSDEEVRKRLAFAVEEMFRDWGKPTQ